LAAIGGGLFLFGKLLSGVKLISGLGTGIAYLGAFVGILGVLGIAIGLLEAALSLAFKIAIGIGAIVLIIWIIKGILKTIKRKEEK
jgi:hypothetical protein